MTDGVAAVGVHLAGHRYSVALLGGLDLRHRADTTDERGIETAEELAHLRGIVALRIDGDVHHLHARRLVTQLPARAREREQRDRADLAAVAEAEGEQHDL